MLTGDELKKAIQEWGSRVGELHGRAVLLGAGIGYTTALELLRGTYPSEPKARLVAALNGVLKQEGKEAAS